MVWARGIVSRLVHVQDIADAIVALDGCGESLKLLATESFWGQGKTY